jgi:dihydroorotase
MPIMTAPLRIEVPRGDDSHLHLRDGATLASVVPHTVARFARAVVMPNLRPPVTTTAMALAYRERILAAVPPGATFDPRMTLYLTDNTPPHEVEAAARSGCVAGVKWYPAGATTNSDSGVTDVTRIEPALAAMAECALPLLVHAEVTDPEIDVFDREGAFLREVLTPVLERHPALRVVVEHVTTAESVDFVRVAGERVAATITAHHLLLNRNALFQGGLRPHHYCLPVLKRERHRRALLAVVASGHPRFFLGTDSAPHARTAKESSCGCAGIYTAHAALEFYAEALESVGALQRLPDFAGGFGADWYRIPRPTGRLVLERTGWPVPAVYPFEDEDGRPDELVALRAGGTCAWRLVGAATPAGAVS